MEPIEYLRLVRRRWRVAAACCLVAAVAVWVVSPSSSSAAAPQYVDSHTLIRNNDTTSQQALAAVGLLVKTGAVPVRVAKRLGYTGDPQLLARSVAVDTDDQLGTITVKATANGRRAASDLANAFAEETLGYLGEQAQAARDKTNADILARLTERQKNIDDLANQAAAARAAGRPADLIEAQRDAQVRLYSSDLELQQKQAELPAPSAGFTSLQVATPALASPKTGGFGIPSSRPARTLFAAMVGLLLGIGVVLVIERVDPRINLRSGAERAFRLPVVAEIPYAGRRRRYEIATVTDPSSAVAEAYRALRAALLLIPAHVLGTGVATERREERDDEPTPRTIAVPSMLGPTGVVPSPAAAPVPAAAGPVEPQVVLVTSAAPSEGKTTTVVNLAASFAEAGRSVLILSCDFRRPSLHEYLGVRQAWGLTEVLEGGSGAPTLADVVKETTIPGVRVATNGSPLDNYGDVSAEGRRLVAEARRLADIVLIDTAPLLVAHEATELIPTSDTVVVVCRSGQTTKEDAGRVRDLLTRLGASVAGIALVGAPESDTGYSTYYYQSPTEDTRRRRWLPWQGRGTDRTNITALPSPEQPPKRRAVI
ncbi:MAG TPA: hypothetical protein VFJ85_01730 [Acidimicrobiales bacterium]|nr:hypothetical protein [Acidimicrobiales bacterium]